MADVQRGDLLRSVLFVRNLVPGGVHTGHFWSLSIEEQFYLFWPLIFLLLRNNARRLAFVVALFSVWPLWYYYRFHHQANAFAFDIRCAYLLAGCGLALGHYSGWPARSLRSGFTRRAVVPAFGVLLIYLVNARWFPVGCLVPTGEAIGIAAIINYAVQKRTALDFAPLVWIGNLSYSLYLWQQLFCYRSELGWFGRLPENVLAAVAASALSFYLLEQPLAKFRRGIRSIPNPRFLERRKAPLRVAHPIPRPENSTVQTVAN